MAALNTWCHRTLDRGLEQCSPTSKFGTCTQSLSWREELNFTRAAHRLNITQPALTRQITDLEKEHRFHLFTRSKRRPVELTDAGRVFIGEAKSRFSIQSGQLSRSRHPRRSRDRFADRAFALCRSSLGCGHPCYPAALVPEAPSPDDWPIFPDGAGAERHCRRTRFGPRNSTATRCTDYGGSI